MIGTIAAVFAGMLTGLLFRPLGLIPVAILLLGAMVYLRQGLELMTWSIGGAMLVAMNVGYLGGALVKRAFCSARAASEDRVKHRSSS